jgi:hypothetical protein
MALKSSLEPLGSPADGVLDAVAPVSANRRGSRHPVLAGRLMGRRQTRGVRWRGAPSRCALTRAGSQPAGVS